MKTISNIFLIFNPLCGIGITGALISGSYFWILYFILFVYLNMQFYEETHKDEYAEYLAWKNEFSKTHDYLGQDYYGVADLWQNKETKEIVEL